MDKYKKQDTNDLKKLKQDHIEGRRGKKWGNTDAAILQLINSQKTLRDVYYYCTDTEEDQLDAFIESLENIIHNLTAFRDSF